MFIFFLLLTNCISIFIGIIITLTLIHNKIKVFAIIQKLLIMQINIIKSQAKIKVFSFTPAQRQILAELLLKINFNPNFCLAFKHDTAKKWADLYIYKTSKPHRINVIPYHKITEYEKQMVIKIHKQHPELGYLKLQGLLNNIHIHISTTSIGKIIKKYHKDNPPDSTGNWKRYLDSIIDSLFSCDFKVVNDKYGNKIFVLFFMNIFSRKIIHFNVTANPTKKWQENQLRQLTDGSKKIDLITDNDIVFNNVDFDMFNINRIRIKPYTPKMNAHIERYIGSFNREALKYFHQNEITEKSLYNIVKEYVHFYNKYRFHQGIGNITINDFINKKINKNNFEFNFFKVKRKTFLNGIHSYYYLKDCA